MTFDASKPCRTRDGREVRIYATDGGPAWPIHGAIRRRGLGWQAFQWDGAGKLSSLEDPFDLVNTPEKFRFEQWINIYGAGLGTRMYPSRAEADNEPGYKHRTACIKVIISGEVGQYDG